MGEDQSQNQDEPTLPTKRKLDPLICQDEKLVEKQEEEDHPAKKTQKLETLTSATNKNYNHSSPAGKEDNPESQTPEGPLNNNKGEDSFVQEREEEEEEEDDDYEEGEDVDEEEEEGEGLVVDKKGKGILIDEEDDDSSDDDDDDDDGSEMEGDDVDSELEEDPLAEVDLDNILPSRTRSRRASSQPGIFIGSSDVRNDHDDSDDSAE